MDKTSLVEDDIRVGHSTVRAIEAAGLPIAVAAWMKLGDDSLWKLYLSSPDVQKYGPTTVYIFTHDVIRELADKLDYSCIVVANTTNHFVNAIQKDYLHSLPMKKRYSVADVIRMNNFTLDGYYVESAYVYKVSPRVKASSKSPKPDFAALRKAQLAA